MWGGMKLAYWLQECPAELWIECLFHYTVNHKLQEVAGHTDGL